MGLTIYLVLFWVVVFVLLLYVYPPKAFLRWSASRPRTEWEEPRWAKWAGRHAGALSAGAMTTIMALVMLQLSWWVDSFWPLGLLYGVLMVVGLAKGAKRLFR